MIFRPLVIAEGSWCLDIETAWSRLFQIIVGVMGQAYAEEVSLCYIGIWYNFFQIIVRVMGQAYAEEVKRILMLYCYFVLPF